ncbi:MAG: nuclear transport factor 2 family protein [Cocleimonas sp.]
MVLNKKEQIVKLLKGIETGDPSSVAVVNENKYIQHNPQTHEGSEGLAVLFKRLSKTNPRVNIVRAFEDNDFVFAHTEYDFTNRNIGFEIFRFEDGQAVEHWDNIQERKGPNSANYSMVDGATNVTDIGDTEINRNVIQSFVEDVLISAKLELSSHYINQEVYIEHDPESMNSVEWLARLSSETSAQTSKHSDLHSYEKCHRILAEGNFVLSVCEGTVNKVLTSFFDLYRLEEGRIVEHWDTVEAIPAQKDWKNDNGKF